MGTNPKGTKGKLPDSGLWIRDINPRLTAQGMNFGFRVRGSGFRVKGLRLRVQGFGFRVLGFGA